VRLGAVTQQLLRDNSLVSYRSLTETSLFAMNVRTIIVPLGDWEKNPETIGFRLWQFTFKQRDIQWQIGGY
jgi:hypothetical protein